jgi:hypothetical protein
MRIFLLLASLSLLALATSARPSEAREYPWCAYYGGPGTSTYNCGFSTYRQCLATISGIGGYCDRNRFYRGEAREPSRRRR